LKLRLPHILAADEEDEEDDVAPRPVEVVEPQSRPAPLHWAWTVAIAAGAALPRLLYLFVFSDPENPGPYGDVWHHWQIAYLTKEIGFSAPNGPRLWDLKGLDYIWGILHPLLMVAIFDVTGSVDIVLDRLVSLVCGVAAVVLLFHICRRLWGNHVAAGVALFAIALPTSVMNDASGMVEPLGVVLSLLGIWAWLNRGNAWAGVVWGLAAMARAEEWLFGIGLVIASLLRRRGAQSVPLIAGFVVVMAIYMKVLLDQTGNPIYPLWWNFIATALGQWQPAIIAPDQAAVRPLLAIAFLVAAAGLAWSLWKRPPSYMLLTFGFGYWVFVAGMFGFTAFLSTWVWWLPISRRFEFPVVFAAVLLVVGLLVWLPRRLWFWSVRTGWVAVVAAVLLSQLLWLPIQNVFGNTEAAWLSTVAEGKQLGAWYNEPAYAGHALAVPPDRPDMTYVLALYGHVEGKHLVSEMYDPFAYLPSGYRVAGHPSTVSTLVQCWLGADDIHLIALQPSDANLGLVVHLHPEWFTVVGHLTQAGWDIVGVNIVKPTAADCLAAKSAS
jgi:hypothetical protein